MRTGLIFALVFFAIPCLATEQRVGVLAVGPDANATGSVQERFETSLREMTSAAVVSSSELAIRLSAGFGPRAETPQLVSLFVQAREAYFDERLDEALERIESASRIVKAGMAAPDADSATVHMWRSAVLLAKQDRARAEAEAKALLAVSPDAKANLNVFRPSFGKFLDEMRREQPASVSIGIARAPKGIEIQIDDHIVPMRFSVAPGVHRVSARALGFLPISIVIDSTSTTLLNIDPALNLGTRGQIVESAAWDSADDQDALEALARDLSLDVIVAVGVREKTVRTAVISSDGKRRIGDEVPRDGIATAVEWVAEQLRSVGTPKPLSALASAGPSTSIRTVGVRFKDQQGFRTTLAGPGASVRLRGEYGEFSIDSWAAVFDFSSSKTRILTADSSRTVVGGRAFDVRLEGARRFDFASRLSIAPRVGIRYANDSSGGSRDFAAYPAFQRADAILGARLGLAGVVTTYAGVFAQPGMYWKSRNGWADPHGQGLGFGVDSGASWSTSRLTFSLDYSLERRSLEFPGPYPIPSSTSLESPVVSDQQQMLSLTAGYRF